MERTRTRDRERVDRIVRARDGDSRANVVYADDAIEAIPADASVGDASATTNPLDGVPAWLHGMRPIVWKPSDLCAKRQQAIPRGRNCCLFSPLEQCSVGMHTINGFCVYHLRAIFNIVYLMDTSYRIVDGQATIVPSPRCFVADPQPIDNGITAVFPMFELFEAKPRVDDIKLHHFARYLQSHSVAGWEKIYAQHVNFLHSLITLRHQMPSSQAEHDLNSTLNVHWNLWNEYQSWILAKYPATMHIFHVTNDGNVQSASIATFTVISQMACRLFSLPYSSNSQKTFVPTVANYGFHVRRHFSYLNNLCSSGTTRTQGGMEARGNLAMLQCVRTDDGRSDLLHLASVKNCAEHRVLTRVDPQTPALNAMTAVANVDCGNGEANGAVATEAQGARNARVANTIDSGDNDDGGIARRKRRYDI